MSGFGDALHRAAADRGREAATNEQILQEFRDGNAAARVEAARRYAYLASEVRDFLVQRGVPSIQMMVNKQSWFGGLAPVCKGWYVGRYFVTVEGRLVRFAHEGRAWRSASEGHLKSKIKPGQRYLGTYLRGATVVHDVRDGVDNAMFLSGRSLPRYFSSEEQFGRYCYGDLLQPGRSLPCPASALLLPEESTELYLVNMDSYDRDFSVSRPHDELASGALSLVEPQGRGNTR
ncbi:hypothetical protein [Streptomyces sp. NPDC056049]|uniref:hypothetical protein n=1 Tax=Streptomyces sp. NPDC056049 TaxID=3345693 RepID=UPI0035E2B4F1